MTRSLNLFLASNQCDLFSRSGLAPLSVLNQADQCKSRPISTYCGLTTVESYTQNDFGRLELQKVSPKFMESFRSMRFQPMIPGWQKNLSGWAPVEWPWPMPWLWKDILSRRHRWVHGGLLVNVGNLGVFEKGEAWREARKMANMIFRKISFRICRKVTLPVFLKVWDQHTCEDGNWQMTRWPFWSFCPLQRPIISKTDLWSNWVKGVEDPLPFQFVARMRAAPCDATRRWRPKGEKCFLYLKSTSWLRGCDSTFHILPLFVAISIWEIDFFFERKLDRRNTTDS